MSGKNIVVVATLTGLALIPVTLTFICSGKNEDAVTPRASHQPVPASNGERTSASAVSDLAVPVFKSFENNRYQQYDAIIARLVDDFNRNPAKWIGGTAAQGRQIPKLTVAQVKAHMIQETGGGDMRSRAAWAKDPLQANVPGDWNPYKKYLGLREPRRRNEGSFEKNLRAGIMLLARKGFGVAGQPASNRPDGEFDGWKPALQRYNGRSDRTADGRKYRDAYADRILQRAASPLRETPIPIPTKKR